VSAGHATDTVIQTAHGGIDATDIIDSIAAGAKTADHAWLAMVQLAVSHGWKSPACRAFVMTLAKRAAGPVGQQQ